MTNEKAQARLQQLYNDFLPTEYDFTVYDTEDAKLDREAIQMGIKALEQQPIDKSAMMYDIYMEGVNMSGEYQGCWVRFKDIEKIVDKYITESEEE